MSTTAIAEAHEAAGHWGPAGEAWSAVAQELAARGLGEEAAAAATRAADAWRRDDRPGDCARSLRLALEHRPATVRDATLLSGALLDAGEVDAAMQIAAAAADGAEDEGGRALVLDVLASAFLAGGRLRDVRVVLEDLDGVDAASARMSASFRRAQLARLDGDLRAAEAQWRALAALLRPHPAAVGALATTWMELGEVAALRLALDDLPWGGSDPDPELIAAEAEACFAQASAAWTRANRRSGLLRAEAWRASLRRGALDGVLDTAAAYADERGLTGMAGEVRLLRAVVRQRPLDALHAAQLARQAPLARGRARVVAAELGAAVPVEVALAELEGDVPWRLRAERLRTRVDA